MIVLAFVSGTGTALTSIRRTQLWRLVSADRDALLDLEDRIGSYQASLVILHIGALVAVVTSAVILGVTLSDRHFGGDDRWWAVVVAGTGSALLIGLVEASVRYLAAKDPDRVFRAVAVPLAVLSTVTKPLTRLAPFSSEAVFSRGPSEGAEDVGLLGEVRQLQELASTNGEENGLEVEEEKMIRAIVALRRTAVKEVMVPRPDITAISVDTSLRDVIERFVESGHSRMPLFDGTLDNVVGVIYARDILRFSTSPGEEVDLRKIAREPYFVPETKKAHDLMREFLAKTIHFALVVDEYGGVEGVISLEDLLEEIVGEIEQEFEPPETPIVTLNEDEAIVEGQVPLDEVNETLSTALVGDGFETIGGFVLYHLGRMPKAGDNLEAAGVFVEVLSTAGRRINKLRVKKVAPKDRKVKAAQRSGS
ncbi:MAG: HlyC/CorC family transporter [Chloroflexi bacterium]|nr:HlyC/CorC family transporter [Chloroflexota bacterium]